MLRMTLIVGSLAVLCVLSHPLCAEEAEALHPPAAKPSTITVPLSGEIVGETEDEVHVAVWITASNERGVPMLSKVPYVSRLFKNVGVAREKVIIKVPRSQFETVSFHGEVPAVAAEETSAATPPRGDQPQALLALPAPPQIDTEIHFFAPGETIKLCRATESEGSTGAACATCPAACDAKGKCGLHGVGAAKVATCCPCANAKNACACKGSVAVSGCPATCGAVGVHVVSAQGCGCGTACQCGHHARSHTAAIHRHLMETLKENAILKAQQHVQHQVAEHQQAFTERLLESRTEIAHLHARLEFLQQREQLVQQLAKAHNDNAELTSAIKLAGNRHQALLRTVDVRTNDATRQLLERLKQAQAQNEEQQAVIAELQSQYKALETRLAKKPAYGERTE